MAPANHARKLRNSLAGVLLLLTPAAAAQDGAPRGFAPADVPALLNAWPFTDAAFAAGAGRGDGAAEATVKALADEISYSARFLPRMPPPLIAAGAELRPPPDTTLWPQPIAPGVFSPPPPRLEASPWDLAAREDAPAHLDNVRALSLLKGTPPRTRDGIAVVSPAGESNLSALSRRAAELGGTYAARLRQRNERPACAEDWCRAMDAVERKAAADRASAPIEEAIADYFFEAAKSGVFAVATRDQQAARDERAAQRRALGLDGAAAGAAAGATPAALPWEFRLLLGGAVLHLRGIESEALPWPLEVARPAADALNRAGDSLAGFDLDSIAVSQYGPSPGARDRLYDLAAAVSFVDAAARRQSYSLVLQFAFEDDLVRILRADAAPIAPAAPLVHVAFVPVTGASAEQLATSDGAVLLRNAANNADRFPAGVPAEYYAFAFLLDRVSPEARVGLRISEAAEGVRGYAGMPAALDYDGWRVVVQRVTFALGAAPPFYFKTVYQADATAAPALLAAVSTYPDAPATLPAAFIERRAAPAAFPNRVDR